MWLGVFISKPLKCSSLAMHTVWMPHALPGTVCVAL
jgi:hypothetical protein